MEKVSSTYACDSAQEGIRYMLPAPFHSSYIHCCDKIHSHYFILSPFAFPYYSLSLVTDNTFV